MLERFGLAGTIVILGVRDHLELCTPQQWKGERDRLEPSSTDVWRKAREALRNRAAG
jgi:DNA-binding transcriptional regulator/RsmH inhibitor MraZ